MFTIAVVFLAFDGITKLFSPRPVVEAFMRLGIPAHLAPGLGLLQLACLVLYVIPRTAVLGAILLAAFLGGAVAIHLRAESSSFERIFPVLIGLLVWGALYLRDERIRRLIPVRA